MEHFGRTGLVVFRLGDFHRVAIQLQCADAIAGRGVHDFAAAPMLATTELAGDHVAEVVECQVRMRDGHEQQPIFLVGCNGLLAELVQFIGAIEIGQAVGRRVECFHQVGRGRVLLFQHEAAEAVVGVLLVSIGLQFQQLFERGHCVFGAGFGRDCGRGDSERES